MKYVFKKQQQAIAYWHMLWLLLVYVNESTQRNVLLLLHELNTRNNSVFLINEKICWSNYLS